MRPARAVVALAVLLAVAATLACGGVAKGPAPPAAVPPAAPAAPAAHKPPSDHTKDRKGAMHKRGSKEAVANCGECHGADLRGGKAPSCYACHDKEWK